MESSRLGTLAVAQANWVNSRRLTSLEYKSCGITHNSRTMKVKAIELHVPACLTIFGNRSRRGKAALAPLLEKKKNKG